MSMSLRLSVVSVLVSVGAVLIGCPTGGDPGATDDDAGMNADTAPPGPPCGRLTTLCGQGGTCTGAPDCTSKVCRDNKCNGVNPADGIKDGDETDVDCGGTMAPACPDHKACIVAADCTSGVCTGGICQVPSPKDGVQNGDETGVDCGGLKAPRCGAGQGCLSDKDCNKLKCDLVNKKCEMASHSDGIQNLDETGIDCGGPTATVKRCEPGQGCVATSDCDKTLCNATTKVCDPPTKSDGIQNGTETDIDCGGAAPTNALPCAIDKGCLVGTDCTSGGCSAGLGNKCTLLSCATAEVAGINSCGAKETGEAGATHESCCKSLVLPTRTTRRLDKYEITSGRYRTFLAKAGPNVRKFVTDYVAANPTSQLATLISAGPNVFPDGSNVSTIFPNADRFVAHSLTAHLEVDIDNYSGIRGCYNGDGNYSANTYWNDATHEADFGLPARSLARTVSDEKPLNCAMPMMLAAFCAWDGGELATLADYHDAWVKPPNTYPWGPTDLNRPNYLWCNGPYQNGGFTCQCDGVHNVGAQGCPAGGFTGLSEAGVFYEFPLNTDRAKDNEPLIAAPGRMVNDASMLTSGGESWHDLYANLAEYTGDFQSSTQDWCDFSVTPAAGDPTCTRGGRKAGDVGTHYTNIPTAGIIGQSWEGHQYNYGQPNAFTVAFQYGKFGGRCVRPATPY